MNHALIRDPTATGDVQTLQPTAVLGNGIDRGFGDLFVQGDVEGEEVRVVLHQGDQARIREALASRQRQALDPAAYGQRHDAAIVDLISEGSQVQALDEFSVSKIRILDAEGLADRGMLLPGRAGGSVPQDIHSIASPPFASEHNMEDVGGGAEFREDADQNLIR